MSCNDVKHLPHVDEQADHHHQHQQRCAYRAGCLQRSAYLTTPSFPCPCLHPKLFTSEPTSRFQPSTSTNSRIFSGVEITTGGNCIIPTEVVIAATTMSITRNGRKDHRADLESRLQLGEDVGRHHDAHRQIFRASWTRNLGQLHEQRQVLLARVPQHEIAHRTDPRSTASIAVIFPPQWERSQPAEWSPRVGCIRNHVSTSEVRSRSGSWGGLRSQCLAQEMKDDQQAHKRRHTQQDRRQQRQQREQNNDAPRQGVIGCQPGKLQSVLGMYAAA